VHELSVMADAHATDFDTGFDYSVWANAPAATTAPTLHHWSDGDGFVAGVLEVIRTYGLDTPTGVTELAAGAVGGINAVGALADFSGNPVFETAISSDWSAIGVGIVGEFAYVMLARYDLTTSGDEAAGWQTPATVVGTGGWDLIMGTGFADVIEAGAGADRLYASGGADRLDGGSGTDIVLYSADVTEAVWLEPEADTTGPTQVLVTVNGAQALLSDVEYILTNDRLISVDALAGRPAGNLAFNESWYLATYPDVAAAIAAGAPLTAQEHYWRHGLGEGRSPNDWFNEGHYLGSYPDVAAAKAVGAIQGGFPHYLTHGRFEGRSPMAGYDEVGYLARNPDVAMAIAHKWYQDTAFDHYLSFGRFEGRDISPVVVETPSVTTAFEIG
jgi:hypothetical protein